MVPIILMKEDEVTTEEDQAFMGNKPYRALISSLMYLSTVTRSDIAVAVARLSRHLQILGRKHWQAALTVLCSIKMTKDVGIAFTGNNGAESRYFCDANWGSNRKDRRPARSQ